MYVIFYIVIQHANREVQSTIAEGPLTVSLIMISFPLLRRQTNVNIVAFSSSNYALICHNNLQLVPLEVHRGDEIWYGQAPGLMTNCLHYGIRCSFPRSLCI